MIFYDWLTVYQDFDFELPFISDTATVEFNTVTGEKNGVRQPIKKYEGSFSTSVQVKVSGNRITVSGNPSRFNRLDNLFGLTTLDQCVSVYNQILSDLGLPNFSKCSKVLYLQGEDGKKVKKVSDGAVITEVHVTSNRSVGKGCVNAYLKGLATQNYRNMIPNLYSDGNTVDWKSKSGNARLIYANVYNKSYEIQLHLLPKIKRQFGDDSQEVRYLKQVIEYCKEQGVARAEQKFKSEYLRRNNLRFWGLFDESHFISAHNEFLKLDEKLQVTAMELETVAERLITEGIVENTKAANTTAMYALNWSHGMEFDVTKAQVKVHRARLRKIGIDIKFPFDAEKHSLISVRKATEVVIQKLSIPSWYQRADASKPNLQLVA